MEDLGPIDEQIFSFNKYSHFKPKKIQILRQNDLISAFLGLDFSKSKKLTKLIFKVEIIHF